MASSSGTKPPPFLPGVSEQEFKMFHNIDRTLYIRLVFDLKRDPADSMQVMALWIWMERAGQARDLVNTILSLPDTLINSLADEAVLCLKCTDSDQFLFSSDINDVPLIHSLTKTGVNLRFFHDNRLGILRAVTKITSEVCARAFDDISQVMGNMAVAEGINAKNIGGQQMNPLSYHGPVINPMLPVHYQSGVGVYGHMESPQHVMRNMNGRHSVPGYWHGLNPYDLAVQREILNNEIGEVLKRLQITNEEEERTNEEKDAPLNDRTIFLTFSKGYPISKEEVIDFFTWKHGDCIESIHMQDVPEEEQPLYARLIVHSPKIVEVFLEGKSKAKFSINGKHAWARKYVRNNP